MLRKIKSDILFTLNQKPIANAIISFDENGTILTIESSEFKGQEAGVEYFEGAICPGFVNAHCHLELSYSRGKIFPHTGINTFIDELENLKKEISQEEKQLRIIEAEKEMLENGIVAVGDICNTTDTKEIKGKSRIKFYNFVEVFGSLESRAEVNFSKGLDVYNQLSEPKSIVPHAPYSLALPLWQMIKDFDGNQNKVQTMHHLESKAEIEYFENASGEISERLNRWGIPLPSFLPSHKSPFGTIGNYFDKNNSTLLVHNTFLQESELKNILQTHPNTFFVLCPISNYYIENSKPDYELFLKYSNKVCLGTDSLASNYFLSILDEMKWIEIEHPDIDIEKLLTWACKNGAFALGMDQELGTIEIGKKPGLVHLSDFDQVNFKLGKHCTSSRIDL